MKWFFKNHFVKLGLQNHFGVPGVLKTIDLFWASQGSCIAGSKLHTLALASSFIAVSFIAKHMPILLPIVAAPKKQSLISGLHGQLHRWFKAAHIPPCLVFLLEEKTDKSIDFHFCQGLVCQKLFLHIQVPWIATYMIQSCTHSPFPCLPSRTKIRQIHWQSFCQGLLAKNYSSISRLPR